MQLRKLRRSTPSASREASGSSVRLETSLEWLLAISGVGSCLCCIADIREVVVSYRPPLSAVYSIVFLPLSYLAPRTPHLVLLAVAFPTARVAGRGRRSPSTRQGNLVPKESALIAVGWLPLAERDESVANPDVVGNCSNQLDLLNQPVVGKGDQAWILRVMRGLETVSNDPGYEGNGFDGGQRALKVAAYLPVLQ